MKAFENIKSIVKNFPLVVLASMVLTYLVIVYIELGEDYVEKPLLIVVLMAIPVFFTAKLINSQLKIKIANIIATIYILSAYFILTKTIGATSFEFMVYGLFLISFLLLVLVPLFDKKNTELNFFVFNKHIVSTIGKTIYYSIVVYMIAGIIIKIVDYLLFHNSLGSKPYQYMLLFILTILGTFFFLSLNNKSVRELAADGEYSPNLEFLFKFIIIPALLVYTLVLYLYFIKLLVSWELPNGVLATSIIIYSLAGILIHFFLIPFKRKTECSVCISKYDRYFFILLLPILLVYFISLLRRIIDYGVTENRYILFMYGVLLTIICLYNLLKKSERISLLPILAIIFIVFSLFFPRVNMFEVSVNSQKRQIQKLLLERDMLSSGGTINFAKPTDYKTKAILESKIYYLKKRGEHDYLRHILSLEADKEVTDFVLYERFK